MLQNMQALGCALLIEVMKICGSGGFGMAMAPPSYNKPAVPPVFVAM